MARRKQDIMATVEKPALEITIAHSFRVQIRKVLNGWHAVVDSDSTEAAESGMYRYVGDVRASAYAATCDAAVWLMKAVQVEAKGATS